MSKVDIKDIQGNIRFSTEINEGSKRRFTLMKEDYISFKFSVEYPIYFKLGDGIDNEIGLFELVDLCKPTYNTSTGGYDYQLRLDAYYWKWKNKIFKYTPGTAGQEASWNLTAPLDVQAGIVLRNLKALGYTYRGQDFDFFIDSTVENKSLLMSYDNINILDACFEMAKKWKCECWVTENIIHFGRCEFGDPVDFKIGVNVEEMTRSDSQSTYATRIYAFGSTRNIPANYRPVDESVIVKGVVQRRLMLPAGTPYIDAYPDMRTEEAVEEVVVFDNIYPRRMGTISGITTHEYTDTIKEEGKPDVVKKWNAYRFKDPGITFSKDYVLAGEELKITFQSGKLNGMTFEVTFNPCDKEGGETPIPEKNEDGSWNPDAQVWEIVRNENYGRPLPDSVLYPKNGDSYILSGWDSTKIAELGLVDAAEKELKEEAEKYVAKSKIDPNTYTCRMNSVYIYGINPETGEQSSDFAKHFDVGDRVNLINKAYFENGRQSRIIGVEFSLDYPYDHPIYTVGETASYSRIGEIEDKIDSLTYKGETYIGGKGSGVYVIGKNDKTLPNDRNVFSALRSKSEFLSKKNKDTVAEDITFKKNIVVEGLAKILNLSVEEVATLAKTIVKEFISSETFVPGFDGEGMKIWKLASGEWNIEVDTATIRKSLNAFELLISKIRAVKGALALTQGNGKVKAVTDTGNSFSLEMEDTIPFATGDFIRCQTWRGAKSKYYWVRVSAIEGNFAIIPKSEFGVNSEDFTTYDYAPEYVTMEVTEETLHITEVKESMLPLLIRKAQPGERGEFTVTITGLVGDTSHLIWYGGAFNPDGVLMGNGTYTLYYKNDTTDVDDIGFLAVGLEGVQNIFVQQIATSAVNVPEVGDEVIQMGNDTDLNRQSMIYISAAEDGRPVIDVLNGINSKSLEGKLKARLGCLDGITDPAFPADMQPSGYGLYCDNVFLKGVLVLSSGDTVDGYVEKTVAQVVPGKISAEISKIRIGGTNLILNSSFENEGFFTGGNLGQYVERWGATPSDILPIAGNKFFALYTANSGDFYTGVSHYFKVRPNTNYVFSIYLYSSNYVGATSSYVYHYEDTTSINNYIGADAIPFPSTPGRWERVVVTFTTKANENYITFRLGFIATAAYGAVLLADCAQLEEGTVVTAWSPSPEDFTTYADEAISQVEQRTNTKLEAIPGQISAEVNSQIGLFRQGSRNYVLNSRLDNTSTCRLTGGTVNIVADEKYGNVVEYSRPDGGGDYQFTFALSNTEELKNTDIVFTVIAKQMSETGEWYFGGWSDTFNILYSGSEKIDLGDGWYQYWVTLNSAQINNTANTGAFGINTTSGTWRFYAVGVYKGNRPCDWYPAPEDLYSYSDTVRRDLDAKIEVNTSAITSKVSQADFNALGQRVGAAESSITAQADQIALQSTNINDLTGKMQQAEVSLRPDNIFIGISDKITNSINSAVSPVNEKATNAQNIANSAQQAVNNINDNLLPTGIDIVNHRITVTTDNFKVRSNAGVDIAIFSIGANGQPVVKAENIDTSEIHAVRGDIGGFGLGNGRIGRANDVSSDSPYDGMSLYDEYIKFRNTSENKFLMIGSINTLPVITWWDATSRIENKKYVSTAYPQRNVGTYYNVSGAKYNYAVYAEDGGISAKGIVDRAYQRVNMSGSYYTMDLTRYSKFIITGNRTAVNLPNLDSIKDIFGFSTPPSDFCIEITLVYDPANTSMVTILNVINFDGDAVNIDMGRGDVLVLWGYVSGSVMKWKIVGLHN